MNPINISVYFILLILISSCSTKSKNKELEKNLEKKETKIIEKSLPQKVNPLETTTTCIMREDIRKIVYDRKSFKKGCKVRYTKFEKTYTIAQSEKSSTYCHQIADRVLSNLQAAGFECQSDAAVKPISADGQ